MIKTCHTKLCSIILATLVLLVVNGCSEGERETRHIDQSTLDYCAFGKGSFWVYQNTQSKNLDTVTIIDFSRRIESIPELTSYDFEEIRMTTDWTSEKTIPSSRKSNIIISTEYADDNIPSIVEERTKSIISLNYIFAIPKNGIGGKASIYSKDTLIYHSMLDSIMIDGATYHNIIVQQLKSIEVNTLRHEYSYWAKDIGRIKFNRYNGEEWVLVDYKIVERPK